MLKAIHSVTVYIDDYEQGQTEQVNSWEEETTAQNIGELIEKICVTLMCNREDFYKNASFEQVNNYNFAFETFFDVLVNVDNEQPTEKEIALWKQGNKELYNQLHHILVSEIIEKPFDITE